MITNDNKKGAKRSQLFCCKFCDYSTGKIGNWKRHVLTLKHKMITNDNKKEPKGATTFHCIECGKVYKYASGLSRHRSKCLSAKNKRKPALGEGINKELLDVLKELVRANKEPKIINNTQNISINMFLNDYCKEAINLTDFVENVKLNISDLLKTKELGYAGGISNIIIKNLSNIPSIKRPIHCSDAHRLVFYVKEEGGWNKDSAGVKMEKAIEDITIKQIKTLQEWEKIHPNYLEDKNLINTWNTLVHSMMSGATLMEKEKNQKNIKKQVAETIVIKDAISNINKKL